MTFEKLLREIALCEMFIASTKRIDAKGCPDRAARKARVLAKWEKRLAAARALVDTVV